MDELHHSPSSAAVSERMSSFPQQQQQQQQQQQKQKQNSGFDGDSNNSNNSNNSTASAAASTSRRVTLDTGMSYGNFSKSSARNSQSSSSSRQMVSMQAAMGDPSMNTLTPITPVPPAGGYLARMNRRGSDPGFYSRENPLPPFAPSPHLPGMNYLPFPSMPVSSRRSTLGAGFSGISNNNSMQFPGSSSRMMMMPSMASMDGGFPSMNLNDSSSPGMDGSLNTGMDDLTQRNVPFMSMPPMDTKTPKRSRPSGVASFPMKLHRILSHSAYSEYIAWLPHGRAWRILKQKTFEKEVIPKFFRSARYASFMRQVNGWGFKRIVEGADLNAYYHESFLRGLPELCAEMRRPQKQKGESKQSNKAKDATPAPDFYKISMIAPLPPSQEPPSTEPSSRPSLTPRSPRPRQHNANNHCDLTTDYPPIDSVRSSRKKRDGFGLVEEEDFKPPMTPRNRHREQQQEQHQHRRERVMTPTMQDGDEISPIQEAFLSCTPMADVASVASDFDNQGDHWGDSPFSHYQGTGAAAATAAGTTTTAPSGSDSQEGKPQAIPSSTGDDFLAVPNEVKIMSPGASLRNSPIGGGGDKDFLTKADLTYLEHQNQFLLEQSRMYDGGPPQQKGESPKEHGHSPTPSDQLLEDMHEEEEGPLDTAEEQPQRLSHDRPRHDDLGGLEETTTTD